MGMSFKSFSLTVRGALLLTALLPSILGLPAGQDKYKSGSPILIFPGLTGSQIEMQNIRDEGLPMCETSGYETLWFNIKRFNLNECLVQEMGLNFDKNTKVYSYSHGIHAKAKDFGLTRGVEYMDPEREIPVFFPFVEHFVKNFGYIRDFDIRAAPYDWRMAANELNRHHHYNDHVRELIEKMHKYTGKKVTLVCFSLGCPLSHYFLTKDQTITPNWKEKNIHAYVTVMGAWDGGVAGLDALITGGLKTFPVLKELISDEQKHMLIPMIRKILGSMQSMYTIIPRSLWWDNEQLISFEDAAYTARDYERMFTELEIENGFDKYTAIQNLYNYSVPPEVPTICMYGKGVDTPKKYEYEVKRCNWRELLQKSDLIKIAYGDGDGIVNLENAEICLQWAEQKAYFESKTCTRIKHNQACGQSMFSEVEHVVYSNWYSISSV